MLMYFNRGPRDFQKNPSDMSLRYNWEFFAVTSGAVAPYFSASEKLEPARSTLWLSPPRRNYSWWSPAKMAERIVFHFSTVDESLQVFMSDRNCLSVPLDARRTRLIERIADEVEPHYRHLTLLSTLYFSKALAELSLLVTEDISVEEIKTLNTKNQIIARRALAFYESQLPRRPLVEEVAEVAGVSPTHIRRIFLETYGTPPKRIFLAVQLERAKRLAANSDLLIDDIAKRSGFVGASHFCALFLKFNRITFSKWRTQLASRRRIPHLRSSVLSPNLETHPREPLARVNHRK